jgi:soluble lytic murein transglycosylase
MIPNPAKAIDSVYGRALRAGLLCVLVIGACLASTGREVRAQGADSVIVDAREALRRKDRGRLATLRSAALEANHPLAMWTDYWEIGNRLGEVQQAEAAAFMARWPGSYVEDRFRNDWLLELGRRRDWANFAAEYPRFRMADDREVSCYALLTEHFSGKDVRQAALATWFAQREADDGCALLAATLTDAKQFTAADAWRKARLAIDAGRLRAARQAAALVSVAAASGVSELSENPARFLTRRAAAMPRNSAELTTLALMRMAANDPDAASGQLGTRWSRQLPPDLAGWAWASIAKQSATKLQPEASDYFLRADEYAVKSARDADWPDDTLAWKVRAALRADNGKARWQQVMQAINAMSPSEQRDPAWVYWKARALGAVAGDSQEGEATRRLGREQMASIAGQMNFYAGLAAESLGQPLFLPARPAPLTAAERDAATRNAGLARALQLISIGLRSEGVREWNYTLRGMSDRELLATAQLACDREVWDRCINTSERARNEIDMDQRFPMPLRKDVVARAGEIGIDPAYVYGLIRQESRFVMDARSSVGASGLMQIMPATARWTAKKIGLPFTSDQLADRDVNLKLGTAYLKLVLDDFGGSQALAAAAYNAGPGRPRKWRDGPILEPAVWAENVPFPETRDYVKKVLSNAAYYAAQLTGQPPSLARRLGRSVGPAGPNALDADLP